MWLELDDLAVDELGQLWRILEADDAPLRRRLWELRGFRRERRYLPLGNVETGPDLPRGLEVQLAEILDQWRDRRSRRDEREEWTATFFRQSGVCRHI